MSINVGLFSNTENELIADKNPNAITTCIGDVRGTVDLLNPTILVEVSSPYDVESANYMSITAGNTRYYFITGKRSITNTLWEITGRADLRKTYYDAIRSSSGIVSRNENNYNMYLKDDKIPILAHKTFSIYNFGGSPFGGRDAGGNNGNRVIMQVLGG